MSVASVTTRATVPPRGAKAPRQKKEKQGRLAFWLLLPAGVAAGEQVVVAPPETLHDRTRVAPAAGR